MQALDGFMALYIEFWAVQFWVSGFLEFWSLSGLDVSFLPRRPAVSLLQYPRPETISPGNAPSGLAPPVNDH